MISRSRQNLVNSIINAVKRSTRWLLARPCFYRLNIRLYYLALANIGVLNYENDRVSGERAFLKTTLAFLPSPVVIDVGANRGGYSCLVRQFSPTATIIALEPHPVSFKALQEIARQNNFTALRLALGSESRSITLWDYENQDGSEHASTFVEVFSEIYQRSKAGHQVDCFKLDELAAQRKWGKIDLLKIDVEGGEYAVLLGARQLLANRQIDRIHFEFNSMNSISRVFFRDFVALLDGFCLFRLLPNGSIPLSEYDPTLCEIFAFQNIVAIANHCGVESRVERAEHANTRVLK